MNTSLRGVAPTAFLFLLALSVQALSQDLDRAELSGVVHDENLAAVRGAQVSIASDSGSKRSTVTDESGRFRFLSLAPAIYSVFASSNGFEGFRMGPVQLQPASPRRIEITLKPASVSASVIVPNEATPDPLVDMKKTVVGTTVASRNIAELPNVRSNVLDVALLTGGAAEEALSTRDHAEDESSSARVTPVEQGFISLSGGTAYSNNLTIDGLDNNDDRTSRERFVPPADSVAELQVIKNQFSAEYGRASGGRINIRTKSGAKAVAGALSFSGRDERLNANTWGNNARGIARPTLRESRSAMFLNGPLCLFKCLHDTFFAATYDFSGTGDTTLIDTFTPVSGNPVFPVPRPNGETVFCETGVEEDCLGVNATGIPIAALTSLLRTPNTSHSVFIKMDSRGMKNVELNASLQFGAKKFRRSSGTSVSRLEEALQSKDVFTDAFTLSLLTFGRRYTNHIRVQATTLTPSFKAGDIGKPVAIVAFRNPLTGANSSLVAGSSNASTLQNFAESRREARLQLQDTLTLFSDTRTLKAGLDLQSIDSRANALTDTTGTFNFPSMKDFVQGAASRFRQNFGTRADVRNFYGGIFLNDEVRAADNLNLSWGARYEVEGVLRDTNNFAPRLGVAWNPRSDGITVIRAGTGMFFNRVLLRTVGDFRRSGESLLVFDTNLIGTSASDARRAAVLAAISQRFPHAFADAEGLRSLLSSLMCGPSPCSPLLGFTQPNSASLPLRSIDPGTRIPESIQFNLGIERQIASGVALEVDFTLNGTRGLWREFDANAARLPDGFSDWTSYLLANPFTFLNSNGRIRTYRFYLGLPTDAGTSTQVGGSASCSATLTVTCWVNLNSLSGNVAAPSTLTADTSNSVGSPIGIALAAISRFRPDQNLERSDTIASLGRSSYRGLVIGLRTRERRIVAGIRANVSAYYTLSHQTDDGINNTSNAEINAGFRRESARGLQDRRHRMSAFGTLFLPSRLGGFRVSPAIRFGSSAPFNIGTGIDRNLDGSSTDRPIFAGDRRIVWRRPGSEFPWETYSRFSLPAIGSRSGTLVRNAGVGPRLFVFDLNFSRTLKLIDKITARPNLEIGNLLNAAVFSYGAEYIDFNPVGANPTPSQIASRDRFLVPSRTLRPREMRVGMRIEF